MYIASVPAGYFKFFGGDIRMVRLPCILFYVVFIHDVEPGVVTSPSGNVFVE